MRIGVLGLQGAVREHQRSLSRLGIDGVVVKCAGALARLSALIFPGGESTAISLLAAGPFLEELRRRAREGFPLFGTCAGMILLAKEIERQQEAYVPAIDITVARNATGRQVESFETSLQIEGIGRDIPGVFIRAPYITRVGDGVSVLARHEGIPVMARQGNVLVASFHPELTDDLRVHAYFASMVAEHDKEVRA